MERLEERWTPTIETGVTDASHAWIVDLGKSNTALEIIDDLATNTTYYKVNGGAEQVLGTAGTLQNVSVDMGAGNDKLTFTTRNGAGVAVGLYRPVEMGSGNDSLTIDTSVADNVLVQYLVTDSAGTDKYFFGGTVSNAGSIRFDLTDQSGNDSYTTTGVATGTDSSFALYIDDVLGNDKYTLGGSANAHGRLFNSIYERAGKDAYVVNALSTGSGSNVNYQFNDLASDDKYTFSGSALDGGQYFVNLTEALGNDSYAANVIVGAGEARFTFQNTDSLGNDKYTFAGTVTGADSAYYVALTDSAGKDAYTLGGSSSGLAAVFSYEIFDALGTDKYTISGSSSAGASYYVKLTDAEGADKYTATGGASASSFGVEVIDYDAAGSDSFAFTPVGGAGATVFVSASLGGGNNSFSVKGARFTAGSAFSVDFDSGAGKDSVTIDDVAIVDSEATYEIDLGAGNDSVSLRLDGQPKTGPAVSSSSAEVKNATYKINLGEGNDSFAAKVYSTWSLVSQSAAGAGLVLVVHGDAGNDKLSFATYSSSAPFLFQGSASRFYLNLFGDDGDDSIALNYGSLQLTDPATSDAQAFLTLQGGSGRDAVSVAGTFLASTGSTTFNIDLGADDDTLTTSIVTTKTTQLPVILGGVFGSEGTNKLVVKKNMILPDNTFGFVNYP